MEADGYRLSLKFIILGLVVYLLVSSQGRTPPAAVAPAQAPKITVETQPGAPVSIASITPTSPDPQEPAFSYLVTNASQKGIDAYVIRYLVGSGKSSEEYVELRHGDTADEVLYPGRSEWGQFGGQGSSEAIKRIHLVVDFVRFADGTTWGGDKHKHAEYLSGHSAGVRAEIDRLVEIRSKKSLEGVLSAIAAGDETIVPPAGHAPQWAEGFRAGVASLKERLKRANASGGAKKVEDDLRQIIDSSARGPN